MSRRSRIARMLVAWAQGRITWHSARLGMQRTQKAICCKGGGMMFCDAGDEAIFFQAAGT